MTDKNVTGARQKLADEMDRAVNLPSDAADWVATGDRQEPFAPCVYAEEFKPVR